MTREQLLSRISLDPQVCFGKPCIRGTRIWVSLIVDNLADGISETEILEAYPQLAPEDIRTALAYAAELTHERIIPIPLHPKDKNQHQNKLSPFKGRSSVDSVGV